MSNKDLSAEFSHVNILDGYLVAPRSPKVESPRAAAEKVLKDDKNGVIWLSIYTDMVGVLVKEYSDKGWGPVDEKAMEGIIVKAKAVADLHTKVASAPI